MQPGTLSRSITNFPSTWGQVLLHRISKIYFNHRKPPGVSHRIWSVNLGASISGEFQTLGGHSCRHSKRLGTPTTSLGAPGCHGDKPGSTGDKHGSAGDMSGSTSNHSHVFSMYSHLCIYVSIYLPIYTRDIWTGCSRCLGEIRGVLENDDQVNSEIYSKAMIERLWRGT